MAKLKELNVDVTARLTVSDETAERCLRLLEMWQADNPAKKIEGQWLADRVEFRIVPLDEPPKEDTE